MRKLFLAALLAVSSNTLTHEYNAGRLHIAYPWALAIPPTSPNGAAYFVVQNYGKEADTLLGADTPRAASAELHEHVHKGEMMSMQKLDSVDVEPGTELRFAPGGYHLMLMGLKQPLVAGERFPLTLHFKKTGDVPVEIVVESKTPAKQGGHEQHRY